MAKDGETVTEFLRSRNQNPEDFSRAVAHCKDQMVSRWRAWDATCVESVRDIKRFGDVTVVLKGLKYLSGYPGIRRETITTVFADDRDTIYRVGDVYRDGGYETWDLDRPERDFEKIVDASWKDDKVVVRLRARDGYEDTVTCVAR